MSSMMTVLNNTNEHWKYAKRVDFRDIHHTRYHGDRVRRWCVNYLTAVIMLLWISNHHVGHFEYIFLFKKYIQLKNRESESTCWGLSTWRALVQGNEMLWSGKSSLESHYPGVKLQRFHDFFLLLIISGSCPLLSSLFLVGKIDMKNSEGCHESRINLSAPCHAVGIKKCKYCYCKITE